MKNRKNIKRFNEEVTIKGNPGIPGESYKDDSDVDYLNDLQKSAKDKYNLRGGMGDMNRLQPLGMQIMSHIQTNENLSRGKEKELEELAKNVIMSQYGFILDDVELDIKLSDSRGINNNLKKNKPGGNLPGGGNQNKLEKIVDPELIKRIHKAKLSNVIIQGEAKNTKHIIHSEEMKDGIKRIFGKDWQTFFNNIDAINKIADELDWIIPVNIKGDMMRQTPEGMAGSVNLDWVESDNGLEYDNDYNDDEKYDIDLDDYESSDDDDDYDLDEPSTKNYKKGNSFHPIIKVRGLDLAMLIHESVKGVYELIASISLPSEGSSKKEIEDAEIIQNNVSSFEDEAEDFKTGPKIAGDLRDFINKNPKASYHINMREFIFGKMMDESYMSVDDFLKLFRGILNKTQYARNKIDSMIEEVISELKNYELGNSSYSTNDYEIDDLKPNSKISNKEDYSKLSRKEILDLIDNYLDAGDTEKVKELSKFIK